MKNIVVLGAGGFIGTNLTLHLYENENVKLTLVDKSENFFDNIKQALRNKKHNNLRFVSRELNAETNFDDIIEEQDIIFHLVSSTNPSTSNQGISKEFSDNVIMTNNLLEACVRKNVKKVVFLSSGGTVYGLAKDIPLSEESATMPINSYGLQKITIEKLLYLYNYMYGLDYRVIRLSNPFGPYQRPNGVQGVITTFIYKALKNEPVVIYGDGSVVRDYIYIDDAIRGIETIANNDETSNKVFNLGTGKGHSINDLLDIIKRVLSVDVHVEYIDKRKADVPVNVLNIEKYQQISGDCCFLQLEKGILQTAEFIKKMYDI